MDIAGKPMQLIIEDLQASSKSGDLFGYWQQEMQLRQQFRKAEDVVNTQISNQADYNFLKRSLYYGPGRDNFLAIVVQNMNQQAILDCVLTSPPEFIIEFLSYLNVYINHLKPSPSNLNFLISMFKEDYLSQYKQLVNVMSEDHCTYLAGRTSNKTLRRLLNDRLANIKEKWRFDKTREPSHHSKSWPTVHGDKIQLLSLAAKMLTELEQNFAMNHVQDMTDEIIDCASLLFRAGLLSDCMGLLAKALVNPVFENYNPFLDRSDSYHGQVNRLLGKVVPLYSLLINPFHPHVYTLENYRSLFPGFSPDPVTLIYLDLYPITQAGIQGQRQYARYEIIQKISKIHTLSREDRLAAELVNLNSKRTLGNIDDLVASLGDELKQSPHEIYIGMEILRFCDLQGLIQFNKKTAAALLRMYLELFYWLPGTPFINDGLVSHLGPLADEDDRIEVLNIVGAYKSRHYIDEVSTEPSQDAAVQQHLSKIMELSKIMGVL